jgi:phage gp36-like protein
MRILEQIKAADDEIDGYLRSRYNLPLTTTPARIKQISKDLSIYNIYKRRHRADMPDSLISLYKSTIGELEQIRKGYISLEITDTPGIVEAADILTNKKANDKIFTRDYLNSF